MFTNNRYVGESFGKQIISELKRSKHLEIASGYFSHELLNQQRQPLLEIAKRGSCKLLFGMIYHERVTSKQRDCLLELDQELRKINPKSGIYIATKRYHGKIFKFANQNASKYFIGSSNFSFSGFKDNIEFNLEIKDPEDKRSIDNFLKFLFEEENDQKRIGYPLDQVTLGLNKNAYETDPHQKHLSHFKIPNENFPSGKPISINSIRLRPDDQPASSLNLYFDKGRKSTRKGRIHYEPRPWYEIEITSQKAEQIRPGYPKGMWTAFAKHNGSSYKLDMITSSGNSQYPKAIQSRNGRNILGELIKGKLEAKGSLKKFEQITSSTLDHYGKEYVELMQMSDTEYILNF